MVYLVDLPVSCPTYYGPHSLDCLKTVWDLVGCLPEGTKFPGKLLSSKVSALSALNYRCFYGKKKCRIMELKLLPCDTMGHLMHFQPN